MPHIVPLLAAAHGVSFVEWDSARGACDLMAVIEMGLTHSMESSHKMQHCYQHGSVRVWLQTRLVLCWVMYQDSQRLNG